MTGNLNFDDLANQAFAPGATGDDYEKLFAAAFSLPEWHFIADPKFSYKLPYCTVFPNAFGEQTTLTVLPTAHAPDNLWRKAK
jgi:hypothetical protein